MQGGELTLTKIGWIPALLWFNKGEGVGLSTDNLGLPPSSATSLGKLFNHSVSWFPYLSSWNSNSVPGFPGGAVVENLPADAGDTGSSPGLGGSHMPRSN